MLFDAPRPHPRREAVERDPGGTCYLIRDALDPATCATLIAEAEARGFRSAASAYPPSYRTNDRQVLDDPDLARRLLARCAALLPEQLEADGARWRLDGLNTRLRLCRYGVGQAFGRHRDGVHHEGPDRRSMLTFMVYLNDAAAFGDGHTRFFASRAEDAPITLQIAPRAGTLIVFDHSLWHDGEALSRGTKYVLRSDIMYRRVDSDAAASEAPGGHLGYVWAVRPLADGRFASAGRDRTIRLWRPGATTPTAVLRGHTASVLALAEPTPGTLWSASRDRTIRRWQLGARPAALDSRVAHRGAALCLAALPDGRVASGGADGRIELWSAAGESEGALGGHDGWVWALATLPGGRLASASEDGSIRIWRLADRACLATWAHPARRSMQALVSLSDGALISGAQDGSVHRWLDGASTLVRQHRGWVRALAWLPDGLLASGSEDDTIQLGALEGPTRVLGHRDFVPALCALPDGRLLSGSYDSTIRIWPVSEATGSSLQSGGSARPNRSATMRAVA